MGAFALAGSIATLAGTVAGQSPWWPFRAVRRRPLCSLVRVRGDTAAAAAVLVLTMFCITEGTPARAAESLVRAELFAAGALFALVLSVAIWPFRPYRPVREAVAACWTAIGDLSAALARVASSLQIRPPGRRWFRWRRKAREALEDARAALGLARAAGRARTKRGLQLLVLYEIAELLLGDMAAVLEALRARTERGELLPESAARA